MQLHLPLCATYISLQVDVTTEFEKKMQVNPLLSVQHEMPSEFSEEVLQARKDELEQMMLDYRLENDDFGACDQDAGKEHDLPLAEDAEVEDDGFDFVTHRERLNQRVLKENKKNKKEMKKVGQIPPPINTSGTQACLEHLEKWFQTVTRPNGGAVMAKLGAGDTTADGASVNLLDQLQQAIMQHQQSSLLQGGGEHQPSKKRNTGKSCAEDSAKKSKSGNHTKKENLKAAKTKNKKQKTKKGAVGEKKATSSSDEDEFDFSLRDTEDESHDSEKGDNGATDDDTQDEPEPKKPASTLTSINKGNKGSKKVKQVTSTKLATVTEQPRKPDVTSRTTWDEHFTNGSTEVYSDALVLKSNCHPITGTSQDVGRQAHHIHMNHVLVPIHKALFPCSGMSFFTAPRSLNRRSQ